MFVEPRLQRSASGDVLVWPTQCSEKFHGSCLQGKRKIFYVNIWISDSERSLDIGLHSCIVNGPHFEWGIWASAGRNPRWELLSD